MRMDAQGKAFIAAGADSYLDEAYGEVASRGYGYTVEYQGHKILEARKWLKRKGIAFFDRTGLFGFESAADAENFKTRF